MKPLKHSRTNMNHLNKNNEHKIVAALDSKAIRFELPAPGILDVGLIPCSSYCRQISRAWHGISGKGAPQLDL